LVQGVVVHVNAESSSPPFFVTEVFDGQGIDQARCRREFRLGTYIRGVVREVPGVGLVLEDVEEVPHPGLEDGPDEPNDDAEDASEGEEL
jgi:hypothetical protein